MATLLTVLDETKTVAPAKPEEGFTLAELYAAVGASMIEIVYLPDGQVLVIDEEGKFADPPKALNLKATALALKVLMPGDMIVGDALLCSTAEVRDDP